MNKYFFKIGKFALTRIVIISIIVLLINNTAMAANKITFQNNTIATNATEFINADIALNANGGLNADGSINATGFTFISTLSSSIAPGIPLPPGISAGGFNSGDNLIFGGMSSASITSSTFPTINFVNFNNKFATFLIDGASMAGGSITLGCPFQSTGGNNGTIALTNGANVTFSGAFSTNAGTPATFGQPSGTPATPSTPGTAVNNLTIDGTSSATFATDLYLSGNVSLANGAVLNINGVNITASSINTVMGGMPAGGGAAGGGSSTPSNINFSGNSTVNSNIGSGGAIGQISIASGTVTFNSGSLNAAQINLTQSDSVVSFIAPVIVGGGMGAGAMYNTPIQSYLTLIVQNTSGSDGVGTIKINNDTTFSKHIGATGARLNSMLFLSDSLVKYQSDTGTFIEAVNIYPDSTLGSGKGSLLVQYTAEKIITNDIGKPDVKLKLFALSDNQAPSTYEYNPITMMMTTTLGQPTSQISTLKTGKKIYANKLDIFPYTLTSATLAQSTLNVETDTVIDALITIAPPAAPVPPPISPTFNQEQQTAWIQQYGSSQSNTVGIVNILGSSTLIGGIGEVNNIMPEVHFNSSCLGNVVLFTGDIYAGTITQAKPNLTLTGDTLFSVATSYTAANSTYSLGLNKLTIKGSGGMSGTSVFNLTANAAKAGSVVIDGSAFTIGGANGISSMNMNLTDLTTVLPTGGHKSYTVFGAITNGGTITLPTNNMVNLQVTSSNIFVDWSYVDGVITQTTKDNVVDIIIDAAQGQLTDPQNEQLINLERIAGEDSGIRDDLVKAIIEGNGEVQEFFDGINPSQGEVGENVIDFGQDVGADVSDMLSGGGGGLSGGGAGGLSGGGGLSGNSQGNENRKTSSLGEDGSLSGISAGDQLTKYGIWSSYSISVNTQKLKGNSPGYVSKNNGITIGFDTLINDATAIGIAFGYIDTRVYHKDSNFRDRTIAKASLVSLYSITELLNNWYLQGCAIFGQTKINHSELRNTKIAQEIAKANYKISSYAIALETGYHFLTQEKFVITPLVGLELDVIGKTQYQESGTTNQNLLVKRGADTKLIGSIGVIVAKNYNISGYNVTPELYGIIRHDLLDKNPKVSVSLKDVDLKLVARTARNTRTFYNLGCGITHAMKTSQVTLGYDCYLGEKYLSHQGSMKLRLNF